MMPMCGPDDPPTAGRTREADQVVTLEDGRPVLIYWDDMFTATPEHPDLTAAEREEAIDLAWLDFWKTHQPRAWPRTHERSAA